MEETLKREGQPILMELQNQCSEMVVLPKVAKKLPQNPVAFLQGKKIPKYIWELKDPWIAKVILIKELLIKKSNTGDNT